MYFMVMAVINELDQCPRVMDAWDKEDVPGITIFESTGLGSVRRAGYRDDLPLMPSLSDLFKKEEHRHRTIFTVVDSEEMADRLIAITQEIIGDLNQPHNGVMFVIPVARVVGLEGAKQRAKK